MFWFGLLASLCVVAGGHADEPELRAWVYAEYPQLDPASEVYDAPDAWEVVCALRDFSYRHTNYTNAADTDSYRDGAAAYEAFRRGETTLHAVYRHFGDDGGGVLCGYAGALLRDLYAEFGFDAWTVSSGFWPPTPRGSRFTHTQTLVAIDAVPTQAGAAERLVTLHDPSTNVSYVDRTTGRPLDYRAIVRRVVGGRAADVGRRGAWDDGRARRTPVTPAFADETAGRTPAWFAASWNVGPDAGFADLGAGRWKFTAERPQDRFEKVGGGWITDELAAEGLPGDVLNLHAFVFRMSAAAGGPDAAPLLAEARAIAAAHPAVAGRHREEAQAKAEAEAEAEAAAAAAAKTPGGGLGSVPWRAARAAVIASLGAVSLGWLAWGGRRGREASGPASVTLAAVRSGGGGVPAGVRACPAGAGRPRAGHAGVAAGAVPAGGVCGRRWRRPCGGCGVPAARPAGHAAGGSFTLCDPPGGWPQKRFCRPPRPRLPGPRP